MNAGIAWDTGYARDPVSDVAFRVDRAVDLARTARTDRDRDTVLDLLHEAAHLAGPAVEVAAGALAAVHPVRRAVAADLLGVVADCHPDMTADVTAVLVAACPVEQDPTVQRSLAEAMGHGDRRVLPALVAYAAHPDAAVRLAAARSLTTAMYEDPDDAGLDALLRLSADPDPEVRNWATFGFGWQLPVDSTAIREALWARTTDPYPEARQEGIRGLARRRDRRVVPLVAALLRADAAHVFTFDAAGFLGDPALLPALALYNPVDQGVAEAMTECDPQARAARDARAWELFEEVCRRWPEVPMALYCERFELGMCLDVAPVDPPLGTPAVMEPAMAHYNVEGLLARAGGDIGRAADLVAADLLDAQLDG
jgi:hypothetical protein